MFGSDINSFFLIAKQITSHKYYTLYPYTEFVLELFIVVYYTGCLKRNFPLDWLRECNEPEGRGVHVTR